MKPRSPHWSPQELATRKAPFSAGSMSPVSVDVRPDGVVIADDGHGVRARGAPEPVGDYLRGFGVVVRCRGIVLNEDVAPGVDVGPERQDVTIGQELLGQRDAGIRTGVPDVLNGFGPDAQRVPPCDWVQAPCPEVCVIRQFCPRAGPCPSRMAKLSEKVDHNSSPVDEVIGPLWGIFVGVVIPVPDVRVSLDSCHIRNS